MTVIASVCSEHGQPLRSIGGRSLCPACLGAKSQVAVDRWSATRERMAQVSAEGRLKAANVPARFLGKGFDSFEPESERAATIVERFAAFVAGFGRSRRMRPGFILIGPPGTGKTHVACAMVQGLIQQGHTACYASLPALTREIRTSFGRQPGADAILRRLVEVDFLVMDEIDLHGSSDNDYNMLYDIINGRYARPGFPTMAISNRSLEVLNRDLDERLVTRLLAGTKPVVFDWPSRREVRREQVTPGGAA